jgi:tetratricopeptide (TPR) repeat protein
VEGNAHLHRQKLIARALYAQGMVGLGAGNIPHVIQSLKESIAISRLTGDKQILGYSLAIYYTATTFINAPDAEEAARESLEIFSHEVQDRMGLGMAYLNMARVYSSKNNQKETQKYLRKLKGMIRETPKSFQVGMFFLGMGMDESRRGNYAEARKIFEEAVEFFKGTRQVNIQLILTSEIGHLERHTGNLTQARLIYQDTIKGWQELGNRSAIAHQLECFGFLAIHNEEPQRAVRLFSAAEALREEIHSPMTDYERVEYEQFVAQLRAILPEAEFHTLWAEGKSMTMDEAIQLALS